VTRPGPCHKRTITRSMNAHAWLSLQSTESIHGRCKVAGVAHLMDPQISAAMLREDEDDTAQR